MSTCVALILWAVIILAVPYALITGANWLLPVHIDYTWRNIGAVWWLVGCGELLHASAHKNYRLQREKERDDE